MRFYLRCSVGLLFSVSSFMLTPVYALEFKPGVGVATEYTDNARLAPDNQENDLITVGYVGASLSENDGPLEYNAKASFNNHSYTQDTFPDQTYFNLSASAGWEMIKNRVSWFASDFFSQRPVNTLNSNTPDNLQDSNILTLGADIFQPVTARNSFTVSPVFTQYYYEQLLTDNRQLALSANWNYQMFRLTQIGLSLSSREVDYLERAIADTSFTTASLVFTGRRKYTNFTLNLGATNVKRDDGGDSTGFSGYLNWLYNITNISRFTTVASTDLTDTSSVAGNSVGNGDDVQVTTDVVRNSLVNLSYGRDDGQLNSRLWFEYRKLTYSDNPLDRVIHASGLETNYPFTQLLTSGAYVKYNRTRQINSGRLDERYTAGFNLRYRFTRKVKGVFDVKYRTKESTNALQNFDEYSAFASLVYGFGDVYRPTRAGGF